MGCFLLIPEEFLTDMQRIVGIEHVSTDPVELYVYGTDASQRIVPPGAIVKPASTAEVVSIIQLCQKYKVSITPRGAATSFAGQDLNLMGGIICDMRRMDKLLEINIQDRIVRAQPGILFGKLNIDLKKQGYFFPPEPGSADFCTLGGMVANNASGHRSVKYGPTREHVLDVEVVLSSGNVIHTGGRFLKSAATYDLTQLFVGSEGTLGIITEVTLKITPFPKFREMYIVSFNDVGKAAECAVAVQGQGVIPEAMEILTSFAIGMIKAGFPTPPPPETMQEGGAMLIMEVAGNSPEVTASEGRIIEQICKKYATNVRHVTEESDREQVWHNRHSITQQLSKARQDKLANVIVMDIGVPLSQVPKTIEEIHKLTKLEGMPKMATIYGHIGDGNLHVGTTADPTTETLKTMTNKFSRAVVDIVKAAGGTLTAEHGTGFLKGMYIEDIVGKNHMEVARAIKHAIDPSNMFNPGQMGLDFEAFGGEKSPDQFVKLAQDFASMQKGGQG